MPATFARPEPAQTTPADAPADNGEVRRVLDAINQVVVFAPAIGNRRETEARVTYALDQSEATCPVVIAALQIAVVEPRLARSSQVALRNVLTVVARCDPLSVAALSGSQAESLLARGSAIGIGGGNSNYDSQSRP